jgi:hypothetical protein
MTQAVVDRTSTSKYGIDDYNDELFLSILRKERLQRAKTDEIQHQFYYDSLLRFYSIEDIHSHQS